MADIWVLNTLSFLF
jgi:hypothetical protein